MATCYNLFILQERRDQAKLQREAKPCPESHGGQWKSHTYPTRDCQFFWLHRMEGWTNLGSSPSPTISW